MRLFFPMLVSHRQLGMAPDESGSICR